MILKLIANKWMMVAIGAAGTVVLGLVVGLWHQTGETQKARESAAVASTLLAEEIKRTQHLRSVIDNQNEQIEQIAMTAKQAEREANKRVNELLKQRSKLVTESENLPPGPGDMNKWFAEQF